MKTKLLAAAVALIVLSAFAKIILYTDKPNAVPVNSDFFSLQRNSDYINSSVAQVKGDWFNNPVFTGNGSINGSFTANNYFGDGSALTGIASSGSVSNIVIAFSKDNTNFSLLIGSNGTNFTLLVGANDTNYVNQVSNLLFQLIASTTNSGQYILSNNGNGTNITNWGVTTYQDIQAANAELTNLFTGLTNYLVLGTDGDGKLTIGSATNSFTAVTIISTTNIFNVSKGGHLTVTNEITDLGITANSIVGTDPNSVLTNISIGAGLTFSGNNLKANATNQVWTDTGGKIAPVTNTLDTILGDISQTPTHVLHIFHTNAANNDVVGIDSTSADSSSMFHIKNRTAQGPFFDYEAANVRWGFGISSGNNFVLRTGPNAADPVNGSTVITMTTNGNMTVRGFTNLNTSASQFKITDSFNGEQTTLNGSTLTNLTYAYTFRTDIGNGVVTFGSGIFTNISADRTLASLTYGGLGANGYETAIVAVTNSDTAVHTLTMPANVIGKPGKVAPGVFYITNGVISQIMISHMGALYTNACYDF